MRNWYLTRRMFLVDTLSGREKSITSSPKVIRVATSVKIRWYWMLSWLQWKWKWRNVECTDAFQSSGRFQLVPRNQEGLIFPPLMTLTYTDVLITDNSTQTVPVSTLLCRTILLFTVQKNPDDLYQSHWVSITHFFAPQVWELMLFCVCL